MRDRLEGGMLERLALGLALGLPFAAAAFSCGTSPQGDTPDAGSEPPDAAAITDGAVVAWTDAGTDAGVDAGPPCSQGTKRCAGSANNILTCNASGGWDTGRCPAGQLCYQAQCQPLDCIPGMKACRAEAVLECRSDGSGYLPQVFCPLGEACQAGECRPWTPRACLVDRDCPPDFICHQVGMICVPVCGTATDCPAHQPDCGPVLDPVGRASSSSVCRCSTDQLCGPSVCAALDQVCEPSCSADPDCATFGGTRSCVGGRCAPKCLGVVCPAAMPRCAPTDGTCMRCVSASDCARFGSSATCNAATGACEGTSVCDSSDPDPGASDGQDLCAYGEACGWGGCQPVADGTCAGAARPWNQAARGPVVIAASGATSATSDPGTECASGGKKSEAHLSFYAPHGLVYASPVGLLQQVALRDSNGTGPFNPSFVKGAPASGAKSGSLTAGICGGTSTTGWSISLNDGTAEGNTFCLR